MQEKGTGIKQLFEKSRIAISASSLVKAEDFEGAREAKQIKNEPNKTEKAIGTFYLPKKKLSILLSCIDLCCGIKYSYNSMRPNRSMIQAYQVYLVCMLE